ncbi:uncharacterized protein LOC107021194 isoform X1 [Solanum pennellii]|uniref:Uncharacterized protein LOC107021194 isoform X1 n=1 Tax=Solanum pennellii TaxID=28526 RepID=A0ABM1GXB4_SOLPN|nr:uncharacterized protein LOC107021194 isoform X1 [Solanum pennellii]
MAWPLLTVSGFYCLGLSQLHVNVQLQPITRREIVHPSIHQCILSVDRIRARLPLLNAQTNGDYDSEQLIEDLRVPQQWLQPSKALEESEWLQTALNKWLDDEYCPEETNIEISKIAANSFYRSLLENKSDIGEILLTMAGDLESISYQESFHGAFSSANAAVNLIIQRLEQY